MGISHALTKEKNLGGCLATTAGILLNPLPYRFPMDFSCAGFPSPHS